MLTSAIVGVLSGVFPKLLELWGHRQENAQELKILTLQAQAKQLLIETQAKAGIEQERLRMDVSEIEAFAKNYSDSLRHDTSSGRYEASTWMGKVLMDIIGAWRACMRPAIASTIMLMYCTVKICQGMVAYHSAGPNMLLLYEEIASLWGPMDWEILLMAISYYLTSRGVEKHFKSHQ